MIETYINLVIYIHQPIYSLGVCCQMVIELGVYKHT